MKRILFLFCLFFSGICFGMPISFVSSKQVDLDQNFSFEIQAELKEQGEYTMQTRPEFQGFAVVSEAVEEREVEGKRLIIFSFELEPLAPGYFALGGGSFYLGNLNVSAPYVEVEVLDKPLEAADQDVAPLSVLNFDLLPKLALSPELKKEGELSKVELDEATKKREQMIWVRRFLRNLLLALFISGFALFLIYRFFTPYLSRFVSLFQKKLLPHEEALQAIATLKKQRKKGEVDGDHFYISLIDILRIFIEKAFAIQAPEQSTEEFLVELTREERISESEKQVLKDFLVEADLIKFAKGSFDLQLEDKASKVATDFILICSKN